MPFRQTKPGGVPMKSSKCRYLPLFFLAVFLLTSAAAQAQQPCESLASVYIPNVTITSVQFLSPGWTSAEQTGFINSKPTAITKPACRIRAFSAPTIDSHIGIEVWLPVAANWNGKFLAIGNPGFIGSIAVGGLIGNSERGWATAATDTGHVDDTAKWAPGHPEKWEDCR
jgi:feruloyl esterase